MVLPFLSTISLLSGLNLSTPTPSEWALFLLIKFFDPAVTSPFWILYQSKSLLALFVKGSLSDKFVSGAVISDKNFGFFTENGVKVR